VKGFDAILRLFFLKVPLARRLFDTEVEALYKLGNHNQIPRLFDRFVEQQELYLVQEYIEGQDLTKELIPGKQLPETEVIKLLQELLEVMAFVHHPRGTNLQKYPCVW